MNGADGAMSSVLPSADTVDIALVTSMPAVVSTRITEPGPVGPISVTDAGSSGAENVVVAVDEPGKPLRRRRYMLSDACAGDSPGVSGGLRCVPSPPVKARSFGVGTTAGDASGSKSATDVAGGGGGDLTGGSQPASAARAARRMIAERGRACMKIGRASCRERG